MKKLLPLLTIMILLKPLWPLVEYVVNYEYIVENLCENKEEPVLKCNGKCYLSKQIAKEVENDTKDSSKNKKVKFEFKIINFFNEEEVIFLFFKPIFNNYQWHSKLKSNLFVIDFLHPPQVTSFFW